MIMPRLRSELYAPAPRSAAFSAALCKSFLRAQEVFRRSAESFHSRQNSRTALQQVQAPPAPRQMFLQPRRQ